MNLFEKSKQEIKFKGTFYVVWKGKKPGIYITWKECQENTQGIKSIYKKFEYEDEAIKAFKEHPRLHIKNYNKMVWYNDNML
jgi:ribonuclease HI